MLPHRGKILVPAIKDVGHFFCGFLDRYRSQFRSFSIGDPKINSIIPVIEFIFVDSVQENECRTIIALSRVGHITCNRFDFGPTAHIVIFIGFFVPCRFSPHDFGQGNGTTFRTIFVPLRTEFRAVVILEGHCIFVDSRSKLRHIGHRLGHRDKFLVPTIILVPRVSILDIGILRQCGSRIFRHFARLHQGLLQDLITIHKDNGEFVICRLIGSRIGCSTRHGSLFVKFRRPAVEYVGYLSCRIDHGRISRGNTSNQRAVFVFVRRKYRRIVVAIYEGDFVLIRRGLENSLITNIVLHFANGRIPALEGVGVLGRSFLGRSFAFILGHGPVFKIVLLQFCFAIPESDVERAKFGIPSHLVSSILGCRNKFRREPTMHIFVHLGRFLFLKLAIMTFRNIARKHLNLIDLIFTVHEGDGVERQVQATHIVNFKRSRLLTARHLPFNGSRLLQHVGNIGLDGSFPIRLFQVSRKSDRHLGPICRFTKFLLVILIANINVGLHPEVMGGTLVFVTENLAGRKVPCATFFGHSHDKSRIAVSELTTIQHIVELQVLGIVPINDVIGQIRRTAFVRIGVIRNLTAPIGHKVAVLEIVYQDRFAFSNLVNGSTFEHCLVGSILGRLNKFRSPALKEVIVFFTRFLLRSRTRIPRHFSFGNGLFLQHSFTIHEGNFEPIYRGTLHIIYVKITNLASGLDIPTDIYNIGWVQRILSPTIRISDRFQIKRCFGPFIASINFIRIMTFLICVAIRGNQELMLGTLVFIGNVRACT